MLALRCSRMSALILSFFASSIISCASGITLKRDSEALQSRITVVREAGAYRCSPKELAVAETQTEFLNAELNRGDALRAERHRDTARAAMTKVVERAKECKPKPVKVAAIKPVVSDRDKDGVPDANDACPDIPGPEIYLGCPDRDGDGIADRLDSCPTEAEDFDGNEDQDGCPEVEDTDRDGLNDPDDKCPRIVGPIENQGCPYEDTDQDGLIDQDDKCPQLKGPIENQGCPLQDRDEDGILDRDDKCPDKPEDKDLFDDEDGCPDIDNDGDGILDVVDTCPVMPETRNGFEDKDGCPDVNPKLVVVNREIGKIEIKQKVYFDSGKAIIKPRSFKLLNEVAQALKNNKTMEVLVEGHTDSRGSDSYNLRLSDSRANAVREYLISQGIKTERLKSMGFGETKPLASNKRRAGRKKNRRVEFTITRE
ncbi:MAG: OmpA family protein [Myxococcota bacterium]|nr:OmpA family protein [Myxococcota bacterium]